MARKEIVMSGAKRNVFMETFEVDGEDEDYLVIELDTSIGSISLQVMRSNAAAFVNDLAAVLEDHGEYDDT